VKIGPADLQIICIREITEGKIYSPVGRFAERAKKTYVTFFSATGRAWLKIKHKLVETINKQQSASWLFLELRVKMVGATSSDSILVLHKLAIFSSQTDKKRET